ncbi:uncharacterized protein LOC133195003 [Saccostrea echinata]|uniref:uncharacterized protein LOC133195003 n=1 Tax=Saccostrea echinata TaxID=191078 RepID=UPI002A7F9F7F|nr:uncharacterized protein LOC133195003 [Saccostrea echinata]
MDPRYSGQDVIRCDLCETAVVQMHCDFCHVNLCVACIGKHVSDDYDKHKVVPFKQRKSTLIYPKCATHQTKSCDLHCRECNIPVCSLYTVSNEHEKHKFLVLSEIYGEKKKSVRKDLTELENNLSPTYKTIVIDIETQMASLDGDYGKLTEIVTKRGEEWHREIDRVTQEKKIEIHEMKNKHLGILMQHLDKIKQVQSLIDKALLSLKVIDESNNVTMALEYTSRTEEFSQLPHKVQLSLPTFSPQNINREEIYKLFGSITPIFTKKEDGYRPKKQVAVAKILLEEPELITSMNTGYKSLRSVTCLSEEEIWSEGSVDAIKCFNIQGSLRKILGTKSGKPPNDISVTIDGYLVDTDWKTRAVIKVKDGQIEKVLKLQGWVPNQLCVTSNGDLLVTMYNEGFAQSKVVRYSGSTEKQTIQFDDEGEPLYSRNGYIKYISENRNLDICVADYKASAVVVVSQAGKLRFRYIGQCSTTKKLPFNPRGITTDSQCQILTSDRINNCIHILDQNGQFLRYIDNCDFKDPYGLCVDKNDNLFVAEYSTGDVKMIEYIIHISHGFEGDIPECLPQGDRKVQECYVTRCRRQRVT